MFTNILPVVRRVLTKNSVFIRIPITKGLAGYAARTKNIVNVPDAYADHRFYKNVDKRTGKSSSDDKNCVSCNQRMHQT